LRAEVAERQGARYTGLVGKSELAQLLDELDEETRGRWASYLRDVEEQILEQGPHTVLRHLDAALEHLLAVGWALRRCYATEDSEVLGPLGDAAHTVERIRAALAHLAKKPEWSQ